MFKCTLELSDVNRVFKLLLLPFIQTQHEISPSFDPLGCFPLTYATRQVMQNGFCNKATGNSKKDSESEEMLQADTYSLSGLCVKC